MASLLDNYSKEEFNEIAKQATTFADFSRRLGYKTDSTNTRKLIKKRIEVYETDISHFGTFIAPKIERTVNNIFIENSTANQTTLRKWYIKGEYTPYVCSICGQLPEWQSKPLTLILDHINGNHTDDRLENLRWVCPNCNQQLDTTGARNIKKIRPKKVNYCVDCGTEIDLKATRCMACYNKKRASETQIPVSRDELKQLIRTMPFTKIGEKFQISDNGVRKWCDKYNLPRKSTEIKQISDEDWSKI